jgi:hypothetical protein
MKRIFKILVILLAVGSLVQAVALAKGKPGNNSSGSKGTGPGI